MKTDMVQRYQQVREEAGRTDTKIGATTGAQKIISGLQKEIVQSRIHSAIIKAILTHHRNPLTILRIMRALIRMRRRVLGDFKITKTACVDGKYYWDLYAPGYGSKAFKGYIEAEIGRVSPAAAKSNRFTNVFVALTKKCALKCEHCFEWEALNQKEKLTLQDIKSIVQELQARGTAQIQLTGGEPMLRLDDIIELLKASRPETDFWILTSGMNLTPENARNLKDAGLTGVVISLDHFEAQRHNQFRGHDKSFAWAQSGVKNAIEANLVTAISICVTKSFVTESNLIAYADLAKAWGVSFIQILEPRDVGHYQGQDVALEAEHLDLLKSFYLKMSREKAYSTYPIVMYHGYHQRITGCFSAGNRNLYVDTDGDVHACPFCRAKTGNVLSGELDQALGAMNSRGCHAFKTSTC
jgi:MoaA/NifB/PqqE/SkfB family radical SAM enzyme